MILKCNSNSLVLLDNLPLNTMLYLEFYLDSLILLKNFILTAFCCLNISLKPAYFTKEMTDIKVDGLLKRI